MGATPKNKGGGVSEKQNYGTPWCFFNFCEEQVRKVTGYGFDKDLCAEPSNYKVFDYFTKEQDALRQSWKGIRNGWLNPEYAKTKPFIYKAYDEWKKNGITIFALIPNNSCTEYYVDCVKWAQTWKITGRVEFYEPGTEIAEGANPNSMVLAIFSDHQFIMGDMEGNENFLSWKEIKRLYPDVPQFKRKKQDDATVKRLEEQLLMNLDSNG